MLHGVSQRHATRCPVCGNSLKTNVNTVIILKKEAIFYSIFDTHISEVGSVIRCKGGKDSTQLGTSEGVRLNHWMHWTQLSRILSLLYTWRQEETHFLKRSVQEMYPRQWTMSKIILNFSILILFHWLMI